MHPSWEPKTEATPYRPRQTAHGPHPALAAVSGSPPESSGPAQTPCPCLGVKGSPVQSRPSRPEDAPHEAVATTGHQPAGATRAPAASLTRVITGGAAS